MSPTAFGPAGSSEALERIAAEIAEVEAELRKEVASQVDLVRRVGEHTLEAGGKRLRPALVTLSAQAAGGEFDPGRTRRLGACMELIHMATLIHDDVIDRADLRRGRPTAAKAFGTTAGVLSGDVLLAKAMRILAQDGDLDVIRTVSAVVVDLAEGEVLELELRGRLDLGEDEHRRVLALKTATFIEACCSVGALCAGAAPERREALRRFGFHLGLAFQIVDDLLDYRGDLVATGKPAATDFREGCATLPLIYLLPLLTDGEASLVRDRFGNGVTEGEIAELCGWMRDRGVFERAFAAASEHVAEAKSALQALPPGPERDLMGATADFVLERNR